MCATRFKAYDLHDHEGEARLKTINACMGQAMKKTTASNEENNCNDVRQLRLPVKVTQRWQHMNI